jgi:hypothetical protein
MVINFLKEIKSQMIHMVINSLRERKEAKWSFICICVKEIFKMSFTFTKRTGGAII